MANKFAHLQNTFRKTFTLPNQHIVQWFPGHMQKGLFDIQAKLRAVDCIVEVHDARIPFSGRNLRFRDIIQLRPHILLLNKTDLTDYDENSSKKDTIVAQLKKQGVDNVYFTNLRGLSQQKHEHVVGEILPTAKRLIAERPRYSREGQDEINLLVIGVPNVGKSTFINSTRTMYMKKGGKATTVGALAGITRSVLSRIKVSVNPSVYIVDTPGIMPPKIPGLITGMRLAACACLPDHLIGEVNIADYILFWLNSKGRFEYVEQFDLEKPIDNVLELLAKIATKNRYILRVKDIVTNQYTYRPDFVTAAKAFYGAFRDGKFGKIIFDDDYL